jgi:hypothetical protein
MKEEAVSSLVYALRSIAHSVTPLDASPVSVGNGKQVGSLTEAVMYLASSMKEIADAINNHADVMQNK